jgi:hypothetical protein
MRTLWQDLKRYGRLTMRKGRDPDGKAWIIVFHNNESTNE